jgi:hypothetical protein
VTRRSHGLVLLLAALAALASLGATATRAAAQASGQSRAALLLTLPSDARALALGDAWGAVADDENALFYNPAQLARVHAWSVGGSLQRYVVSTTLGAFAAAGALARGTVAIGVQVLDYGTEPVLVSADGAQTGDPTGASVSAQDFALTAGYGATFGAEHRLRIGGAVKYAQQHVANYSGSAVAGDVGAAYSLPSGWELAGALQHFGSELTLAAVTAPLPWTWRVGAASPVANFGRFALRTMAEVRKSSGGVTTGVLAAEGTWHPAHGATVLAARAGYSFRGTGDDRSPLTLGGGVTLGRFTVDYAYQGFDLLGGATHRFGVRYAAAMRGS